MSQKSLILILLLVILTPLIVAEPIRNETLLDADLLDNGSGSEEGSGTELSHPTDYYDDPDLIINDPEEPEYSVQTISIDELERYVSGFSMDVDYPGPAEFWNPELETETEKPRKLAPFEHKYHDPRRLIEQVLFVLLFAVSIIILIVTIIYGARLVHLQYLAYKEMRDDVARRKENGEDVAALEFILEHGTVPPVMRGDKEFKGFRIPDNLTIRK